MTQNGVVRQRLSGTAAGAQLCSRCAAEMPVGNIQVSWGQRIAWLKCRGRSDSRPDNARMLREFWRISLTIAVVLMVVARR